jgi:hypothetical protein
VTRRDQKREQDSAVTIDFSTQSERLIAQAGLPPHLLPNARKAVAASNESIAVATNLACAYASAARVAVLREAFAAATKWAQGSGGLPAKERAKYESVRGKLATLAAGDGEAAKYAANALGEINKALLLDVISGLNPVPDARRGEYAARDVARSWCRCTGHEAKATWDQSSKAVKSGQLHQTPLVRFVQSVLRTYFPELTAGEVKRGIEAAAADPNKRVGK